MSRPAVSQHLRVLAAAGLVDVRADGNRRLYRWRREGLEDAATFLEEMWSDRLARLKSSAEREEWPHRTRRSAAGDEEGDETLSESDTRIVEQTVRINAWPETVWRYWTDPARMCDWWGAAAELDPRPGGTCQVEMGGGPIMRGEYLELVPYERIVFSFGWEPTAGAPDIAPGSTRVEITLTADDDDTIMTLRHTGIPAAHADEHRSGWAHFLALLAGAVSRSAQPS